MSPRLRVARSRQELDALLGEAQRPLAVVMTMGALHDGHAALMRAARVQGKTVLVTIFVNPLQFGPGEDFERYPRTLDADLDICRREGVSIVFAPEVEEIYPGGEPLIRVCAGRMGAVLEGEHRPGHFDGVLTVVAKLLHLTRPDIALFGRKDAQQLLLIRRMARDLEFPVWIEGVPTVREPDGLARSSRNAYLSDAERGAALALSRALTAGTLAAGGGAEAVRRAAQVVLASDAALSVDYLALRNPSTLEEVGPDYSGEALLLVAARVGGTRLIDNMDVSLPPRPRG